MKRKLIFVHGRAQEDKDSVALKAEWIAAWDKGLALRGLARSIGDADIRFPYFGDTLAQLAQGLSSAEAANVIIRGTNTSDDEKRFTRAVIDEMRRKQGITDAQLAEEAGRAAVDRGLLQWEWFHGVLQSMDRRIPGASGANIALFTHDVYQYLKNDAVRIDIDDGVSAAFQPGVETIVVAHSLGTIVAYRLLRLFGQQRGWRVPLFVTVGSPLAVQEIRSVVKNEAPTRCPECASAWFNAYDDRDVVALYPLDAANFPLDPAAPSIVNKGHVINPTPNRHGITGYLGDPEVAQRIHDALMK